MERLVKMLIVVQLLTIISLTVQSCSRPAYAESGISYSAARMADALERIARVLEKR